MGDNYSCGVAGLCNVGNTCYMNSSLQCLSATTPLVSYLINKLSSYHNDLLDNCKQKHSKGQQEFTNDDKVMIINMYRSSITHNIRNLFSMMWGERCKICPSKFKKILGNKNQMFDSNDQQDAQECLSFIIDTIHEETYKQKMIRETDHLTNDQITIYYPLYKEYVKNTNDIENSKNLSKDFKKQELHNLTKNFITSIPNISDRANIQYYDVLVNDIAKKYSCVTNIFTSMLINKLECDGCKNTFFNFNKSYILQISAEQSSLKLCLDKHFEQELLQNYECYYCNKHTNSIKIQKIQTVPKNLIIQFKRFTYQNTRVNTIIDYPISGLDIREYVENGENGENGRNTIYDLYAIVIHTGKVLSGHYVAITKNKTKNKWYLFDDEHVLYIEENDLERRIKGSGAYLLFYEQRI